MGFITPKNKAIYVALGGVGPLDSDDSYSGFNPEFRYLPTILGSVRLTYSQCLARPKKKLFDFW